MLPLLYADKLSAWITPLWLLSVGVAMGVVILVLFYVVLRMIWRRAAEAFSDGIKESWLLPAFYLALFFCLFSLAALPIVPFGVLARAVSRIPSVGAADARVEVPKTTNNFKYRIPFRLSEIQEFTLSSDRPLTVYTYVSRGAQQDGMKRLYPGEKFTWKRAGPLEKPFEPPDVTDWLITNVGDQPATLTIQMVTAIEFPQVRVIPAAAILVVGLVTIYMLLRWLAPKVSAIALATAKETMGQSLFYLVLALGAFMLLAFVYIPYNTFGEDIKMLKDSGLTCIMLGAILLAVWSASTSISDEIEGRTALTLLSKPISRRQFVVGKFLGIVGPVILVHLILGTVLLATVSYKVVYDARETAQADPNWQQCFFEMIRTVPGMVLSFYETLVLASVSVAMSTRLPMIANLLVCFSIYVLGHLAPMIVNSAIGKFPIVEFVGQLITTILPNLDHFDVRAAIAAGADVPLDYLGWTVLYCVLFCSSAMLLALALFEDRDLA